MILAAPAVFRVAPSSTVAADVVGAMLGRWHYIALVAPLLLFALEGRHARPLLFATLLAALLLAAAQVAVDLRIRAIRHASPVAIGALERTHPLRRRFGLLHGASMLLLATQTAAAAVVVTTSTRR